MTQKEYLALNSLIRNNFQHVIVELRFKIIFWQEKISDCLIAIFICYIFFKGFVWIPIVLLIFSIFMTCSRYYILGLHKKRKNIVLKELAIQKSKNISEDKAIEYLTEKGYLVN